MNPLKLSLLGLLLLTACGKSTVAKTDKPSPEVIAEQVWTGIEEYAYEKYLVSESDLSHFEMDALQKRGMKSSLKAMKESISIDFGRDAGLSKEDYTLTKKEIEPIFHPESMNPPHKMQKITYHIRESFGEENFDSSLEFTFIELEPDQWKILALRLKPKM